MIIKLQNAAFLKIKEMKKFVDHKDDDGKWEKSLLFRKEIPKNN